MAALLFEGTKADEGQEERLQIALHTWDVNAIKHDFSLAVVSVYPCALVECVDSITAPRYNNQMFEAVVVN